MTLFVVILAIILFLLAGRLVAVAYGRIEHGCPHVLRSLWQHVFLPIEEHAGGSKRPRAGAKANGEFVKWLNDWRVEAQPTRVSPLLTEKTNDNNAQRRSTGRVLAPVECLCALLSLVFSVSRGDTRVDWASTRQSFNHLTNSPFAFAPSAGMFWPVCMLFDRRERAARETAVHGQPCSILP